MQVIKETQEPPPSTSLKTLLEFTRHSDERTTIDSSNENIEENLQQEGQTEVDPEPQEVPNDESLGSFREELVQSDFDEENTEVRRQLRYRLTLRKPEKLDDLVLTDAAEIIEPEEPLNYKEAITCKERENWIEAMQRELQSLEENCTWVMTKLPPGKKAILNK